MCLRWGRSCLSSGESTPGQRRQMAIRVALAIRSEDKGEPYRLALQAAGLEPVKFAPGSGELPDTIAGLVLSGGTDIDPALYGARPVPESDSPDRERDD